MIKLSFTFIHSFINLFIVCLKGMGFKKHRSYPIFKEDYNLVEMDKHIHTVKWIIKKAISELSQISKVWGAESLWAGYVELRGAGLYTKQALAFRREDSQDPSSQRQESTLGNKRQSILSEMKLSFCPFYSELHKIGQDSEKGCYGYLKQEQTLSKEVSCFLMKILLNMEIILSYSIIIPRPPPPPHTVSIHSSHCQQHILRRKRSELLSIYVTPARVKVSSGCPGPVSHPWGGRNSGQHPREAASGGRISWFSPGGEFLACEARGQTSLTFMFVPLLCYQLFISKEKT